MAGFIKLGDTRIRLSNIKSYGLSSEPYIYHIEKTAEETAKDKERERIRTAREQAEDKERERILESKEQAEDKERERIWTAEDNFAAIGSTIGSTLGFLLEVGRSVFLASPTMDTSYQESQEKRRDKERKAAHEQKMQKRAVEREICEQERAAERAKYKQEKRRIANERAAVRRAEKLSDEKARQRMGTRKYLYVTTFQGDNYRFYEDKAGFDIKKKCEELDTLWLSRKS
ncbi:MAG: hypothetical protein FWD01_04530 [Defluviitaleaceae bacterium]|nr:hypothetical protein [Defluviitaleaceae bacterium]